MSDFITFKDKSNFKTCFNPVEMFMMGIFGNAYIQINTDLPKEFLDELEKLEYKKLSKPDFKMNHFFQGECGSDLNWWKEKNLINEEDPNGWVEWYIKFYYGRRHKDDDRQIKRHRAFVARHLGIINKHPNSDKSKQNLLHWAWDYKKKQ